jgi:[acyl-carrier-protein] S-malonyltransferase
MASQLGADWRAHLVDEAWAERNTVAQPLLTGIALAAWAVLAPQLPQPVAVAGYSVGELAAFSVAGLFDADTALDLAAQRAAWMDACTSDETGGLLAVQGVGAAPVAQACAEHGLAVAIRLAMDRCILGGPVRALNDASPALVAAGGELKSLRVRVASHTPAMHEAARRIEARLESQAWSRSRSVVVCNLDGVGRRDAPSLKQALARQIDHTVQWQECLTTLAERRPRCVLEVGPGQTLARLWAAAHPEVPVRSIDDFQSPQAVVDWVRGSL